MTQLQAVEDWVVNRPDLYATGRASFDWRWRLHKARYLRTGAVLIVGGRRMIDPQVCERVEMELAREASAALLAREGVAA